MTDCPVKIGRKYKELKKLTFIRGEEPGSELFMKTESVSWLTPEEDLKERRWT